MIKTFLSWYKKLSAKGKFAVVSGVALSIIFATGIAAANTSSTQYSAQTNSQTSTSNKAPVTQSTASDNTSNDTGSQDANSSTNIGSSDTSSSTSNDGSSDTTITGVDDTNLSNDTTYTNVNGTAVHSPADSTNGSVPVGATAQCIDGTYSFSQHHQGSCSYHGGVAQWLD